jgi:hypothetical protein
VQLLYNHYKEHFATLDGRLAAAAIDEVYCFHAAYRGEFRLHLAAVAPGAGAASGRVDAAALAQEEVEAPSAAAPAPVPDAGTPAAEPSQPSEAQQQQPGAHAGPSACGGVVFTGLPHGGVFRVLVEDDPRYAPKGPPPPIRFLAGSGGGGGGGAEGGVVERAGRGAAAAGGVGARSRGVAELTAELKGLAVEELSGERYKQLLEAREVEMALFSGGIGGE